MTKLLLVRTGFLLSTSLLWDASHGFTAQRPSTVCRSSTTTTRLQSARSKTTGTTTTTTTSPSRSTRTILQYQSCNSTVAIASLDHLPASLQVQLDESSSLSSLDDGLDYFDYELALLPLDRVVVDATQENSVVSVAPESAKKEAAADTDTEPMSDVNKARLLLFVAAALYGTNFSLVKILGETGMSVGLSSTMRFGMAALATLPWLLAVTPSTSTSSTSEDDSFPTTTTTTITTNRFQQLFNPNSIEFLAALGGLEVGMWNSIGYVAQAVGLETTSASKSAFLCSLAVCVVPLLDYLIGKQLLSRQVIGTILAVVGVAFLELEGMIPGFGGADQAAMMFSPGDIASLVQPIAFGLGFWRMEAAMAKYPNEARRATASQLLAVFLGSGAYTCAMSVVDPTSLPPMDQFVTWISNPTILFALFWTGVITTAMTIYMETVALKTLSAAETTLIMSTEPLWGASFASVVMGETLGLNAAVGAVMILFGCVFSNLGMNGILSFIPGFAANNKNNLLQGFLPKSSNNNQDLLLEEDEDRLDEYPIPAPVNRNMLPTGALGKFSLKSGLAGVLTGIVVAVERASSTPTATIVAEEVQEFIENMPKF